MINVSDDVLIHRLDEVLDTIHTKQNERVVNLLLDLKSLISCTDKEHKHLN